VSGDSGSNDGERPQVDSEASHDVLGDTQLGRSLKELIQEIGKEKDALQKRIAGGEDAAAAPDDSFEPSASQFDQDLEQAVSQHSDAKGGAQPHAAAQPPAEHSASAPSTPHAHSDAEISEALSGMQDLLQRFAETERRRAERELSEWKEQLKKATMIVIKKQVDAARARWEKNQSGSQTKVAEQYQRLKALADKVARQKAQIQKAKKELEQKLEVADRLHDEFDEIRNVLGGQIGAINALDDNDDGNGSAGS